MIDKINPLVSVCIPVYEMNGKGVEYLDFCIHTIRSQTYKNFEIVVSDHSQNNHIEYLCSEWSDIVNTKYIRNEDSRGSSSANINKAMQNASGDIIKILFQDDYFHKEDSLQQQVDQLKGEGNHWLTAACFHFTEETDLHPFFPRYNDLIHYANNTIGPPSVLMFWNEDTMYFDENLIWLMDVDYYKRLYDKYGLPSLGREITIMNREHSNQVSNTMVTTELQNKETQYIIKKYEGTYNISK